MRLPNRYLMNASGGRVDGLSLPVLLVFGPMALSFGSCIAAAPVGQVSEIGAAILVGLGFLFFIALLAIGIPLESRGHRGMDEATYARQAGNADRAIELSQKMLRTLFRRDIRMRAYHTLGLIAESRGEFAFAEELFELAEKPFAAFLNAHPAGRAARALVRAHRTIALVGARRLDEAEACMRMAWDDLQATMRPAPMLNAGSPAWLAMIDGAPREPRTLVVVATIVVLSARGRAAEAADCEKRETYYLGMATPPERALVEAARALATRGAGPHRAPAQATTDGPWAPWAARVLGSA